MIIILRYFSPHTLRFNASHMLILQPEIFAYNYLTVWQIYYFDLRFGFFIEPFVHNKVAIKVQGYCFIRLVVVENKRRGVYVF